MTDIESFFPKNKRPPCGSLKSKEWTLSPACLDHAYDTLGASRVPQDLPIPS